MQQSSSWEVNTRPATQEQRVLRKPNFRQFNVLTTFRPWDPFNRDNFHDEEFKGA